LLRLRPLLLVSALLVVPAAALAAARGGDPDGARGEGARVAPGSTAPGSVATPPAGAATPDPPARPLAPPETRPSPRGARPRTRARARRGPRPRAAAGLRLRLGRPRAFALSPPGRPRAGLLADLDSGRVLWSRAARSRLPVASLTKVMTALLVVQSARVGERARITADAVRVRGSRVGLPPGRSAGVQALLHAMLLASGNDAAAVLARHVGGTERRFVARMNRRARAMGLRCTRFVNPHGVGPGNRSCPADLARLARAAMDVPRIARIVARPRAHVALGGAPRTLGTTNPLLRGGVPGTLGLKTGTSPSAGRCLIAVVRHGDRRLVAVLLRSADPGGDARALLRHAAG